ncbi:MAG TPA: phosphatase PAP2 family protein [Thermoanaerobaculia bacterium]|nr:phosphatase PAP2 family protein [Thermoanaerobaculia bacterium]HPA52053.1 phosphatase PAP2 family protein [Thermoanaerobaculia bacterium]HQP85793.1 phosphatase PAP2 family protein [Thermoanaerobaculia bacterium]
MLQRAVRFALADLLTCGAAALLLAVGLAGGVPASAPAAFAKVAVALALPLVFAAVRGRRPAPGSLLASVADFGPILPLLLVFDNLGPFVLGAGSVDLDPLLVAADRLLFGGDDPTRLLEPYAGPLLLEVLTVCYALYYFHPIVLGALLWKDDLREKTPGARFPAYVFGMLLVFYVSYAGYFAVPAIGPRFTVPHDGPLPRAAVAKAIDDTLDRLETSRRNCFPSGHTMVTIAVLVEAARRSRKTFLAFLPFATGLVLATVFCRYHYVVDVLAGLVLAFVVGGLARWLARRVPQEADGTVLATSR